MNKIRVLHLTPHLRHGGAEVLVYQLARHMDRTRFEPLVASWEGGRLADRLKAEGIPVFDIPAHPRPYRMAAIARHLKEQRIDILHTHLFVGGFYGRMAAIPHRNIGVVRTHHGLTFQTRTLRRIIFESLLYPLTDQVVAVSEAVKTHILKTLKWPPHRVQVIVNGIETGRFAARRRRFGGAPKIAAVGRLSAEKGYTLLIQALLMLREQGIQASCVIAGDGPEKNALMREVVAHRLENNVRFAGDVDDVAPILADADLFVLPSHEEGLSLSLLEAMASGLPVVATAVGGTADLLGADSGYLVRPGDPAALANGIRRVLLEPQIALDQAAKARSRILKDFSIQRTAAAYEALYRSIAKKRQ